MHLADSTDELPARLRHLPHTASFPHALRFFLGFDLRNACLSRACPDNSPSITALSTGSAPTQATWR
eukprot:481205-Pleurochrysis_carterae.AAC.1